MHQNLVLEYNNVNMALCDKCDSVICIRDVADHHTSSLRRTKPKGAEVATQGMKKNIQFVWDNRY